MFHNLLHSSQLQDVPFWPYKNKISFPILYSKLLTLSLITKKLLGKRKSILYIYIALFEFCVNVCTCIQVLYIKAGCPAEGSFETECEKSGQTLSVYRQTNINTSSTYARAHLFFFFFLANHQYTSSTLTY